MSLSQFVREYRAVRRAEGWGSDQADYYRALPYRDLTARFDAIWRIRARSFDVFITEVLSPLERRRIGRPLTVLDLGSGNGWLAYRLARRGHAVIALDLLDDALDGLGAIRGYREDASLRPVLSEFDRLPLPDASADLAVFNASLHYSTDYCQTLRETLRVLRTSGTVVILDSPLYSDARSGDRMVREREARFLSRYGFASNALPCEHFLTPRRLDEISARLGISWRTYLPRLDFRTSMARKLDGLRARREPARFPVVVGGRSDRHRSGSA